jgi:hypothetical protein
MQCGQCLHYGLCRKFPEGNLRYYNFADKSEECEDFENKAAFLKFPKDASMKVSLLYDKKHEIYPYRVVLEFPQLRSIEIFETKEDAEFIRDQYIKYYQENNIKILSTQEEETNEGLRTN